jgi:hypothetical protein
MYGLGYDIRLNSFDTTPVKVESFPETIRTIAEGSSNVRELWFVVKPQTAAA